MTAVAATTPASTLTSPASLHVLVGAKRVRLDDRNLIGEGGEGRVYRVGDLAVKIFTTFDHAREEKLRAFPQRLPPRVIAPIDLCTDAATSATSARGSVIGFSMRALDGAVDLSRLSQRRWRETRVDNSAVLRIFRDLSETIDRLHTRGVVVGDLNDGNVMLTTTNTSASATTACGSWVPWLIDADSMQFGAHPCIVAHERFLDPQLYNVDLRRRPALSRETDWYALAVLLFGSLLYIHPFGGAHPSYPTMLRRAEARVSVLRPDVKLPAAAVRPDVLSDDALAWFERVFERDAREQLPSSVLEARFRRCSCGVEHARVSCPMCSTRVHFATPIVRARGHIRTTRVFRTERGRVVTAVVQNGLKHVYEEAGALFREDGSVVLSRGASDNGELFQDPNRIVRIEGTATWVGATASPTSEGSGRTGRIARVIAEHVVESFPVGLVRGTELAADVGPEGTGLVSVQGDVLVRASSSTRVGQVLEGQTYVRVASASSSSMGFAFYRAGEITVAFVFDTRRGTLRQIDGFPRIEGKLLGWSAVFDEAHVLVTFAIQRAGCGGRVEHAVHLVNARAELVASTRSESDPESPLCQSLNGRAIAGGNVIVATDDGLLLLKADRTARAFVNARHFPEAKDFVSPDDELLVGPGGSLFAVTHDEINHLCFTT